MIGTLDGQNLSWTLRANPRVDGLSLGTRVDRQPRDRKIGSRCVWKGAVRIERQFGPDLRPRGVAFENFVIDQPAFFRPAPGNYLHFDTVLLHVSASSQKQPA